MNNYEREIIKHNFITQITNSWSWAKLTITEQEIITNELENLKLYANNSKQCYYILNAIYHTFLLGLNYKPTGWRE